MQETVKNIKDNILTWQLRNSDPQSSNDFPGSDLADSCQVTVLRLKCRDPEP